MVSEWDNDSKYLELWWLFFANLSKQRKILVFKTILFVGMVGKKVAKISVYAAPP